VVDESKPFESCVNLLSGAGSAHAQQAEKVQLHAGLTGLSQLNETHWSRSFLGHFCFFLLGLPAGFWFFLLGLPSGIWVSSWGLPPRGLLLGFWVFFWGLRLGFH